MSTSWAFEHLAEEVDRHLRKPLALLGFSETGRRADWFGGDIIFSLDDLLLVSYESHDWGLSVRLGVPSPTATSDLPAHIYLPDYTAYTTAPRTSRRRSPSSSLRSQLVLPRQKEVQTTLRNRNRRRRTR